MRKQVKDISKYKGIITIMGDQDAYIDKLCLDSRKVENNSMFFAVKGTLVDAHQYIDQAIQSGASCIVCSDLPDKLVNQVVYIQVDDVQQSCGYFASEFYENPSSKLKLCGVTGTNGKTSVCTMLYELFRSLGNHCGLLSTVENRVDSELRPSTHTTPDPISLNELLNEMLEVGCEYCFMEVSSHAIVQGRINGLHFSGGVFTNITHDHLDYHGTFDNYLNAKKQFFDELGEEAFALSNNDDRNGKVMTQNSSASRYTYSLKSVSDFKCKIIENDFEGLLLKFDQDEVWFRAVGEFNAYNLLAVYSVAFLFGVSHAEILTKLSALGRVNGRFEVYRSKSGVIGVIDYAHTPDALENVLSTIQNIRSAGEQLLTVMGCGGNRDKTKRPMMGKVASRMSDKVIVTSDNPRDEDPEQIIEEVIAGVEISDKKKVLKISDRREAIRTAVMLSKASDIILIAGKGHETYQEIKGVKYPFDDRQILQEVFNEINA